MPYVFDKRSKYMGNDVDIWEMAKIFLKLLRYLQHTYAVSHVLKTCPVLST